MTIFPALFQQTNGLTSHCSSLFNATSKNNEPNGALISNADDSRLTQTKSVFNRIPRPKTTGTTGKATLVRSIQQFDRRQPNSEPKNASSSAQRRSVQSRAQLRPGSCQVTLGVKNDDVAKGRRDDSSSMSVSELPPIGKRPGSGATSKLSSRGSSKEYLRGSIIKYERKTLISVDNLSSDNGRYSKRSLGSEESSAWSKDRDSSSNVNSATDDKPGSHRESLHSNSITQGPNKLSTLFESNVTSPTNPSTPIPHDGIGNGPQSPRNSRPQTRAASHERRLTPSRRTGSMKSLVSDRSQQSRSTAGLSISERRLQRKNSDLDFNGSVSGKATSRSYLGRRTPSVPSLAPNANVESNNQLNSQSTGQPGNQSQTRRPSLGPRRNSQTKLNNDSQSQNGQKQTNSRSHRNSQTKPANPRNDDVSDIDWEKEKRIWDWLESIVGAERPPSPIIFEDDPVQTDTAIHIVYDGD